MKLDGILFDKDGTLFDFGATWNAWAASLIRDLAAGDDALARRIAAAAHFDLATDQFAPTSPIIAGTNREAAECIASALPGRDVDELEQEMMIRAASAPLQPPVPLDPLLAGLAGRGLQLGVMTNDSEYAARAHMGAAGVADRFRMLIGFDSGHGAKPAPTPLLAFASACGLDPARVAMVGDSTHDLIAGRAAGMVTVAVMTGLAGPAELSPHADVILPHIGHLPDWLDAA
ncbi:MAG: HAD family hydrolase [Pseudooceanicola atlanticus]